MKLIVGARRSGKTTRIIQESQSTGYPILVSTYERKRQLVLVAQALRADIPEPYCWHEIITQRHKGKSFHGFLIDDLEDFLMQVLNIPVRMITSTPTEGIELLDLHLTLDEFVSLSKEWFGPEDNSDV